MTKTMIEKIRVNKPWGIADYEERIKCVRQEYDEMQRLTTELQRRQNELNEEKRHLQSKIGNHQRYLNLLQAKLDELKTPWKEVE